MWKQWKQSIAVSVALCAWAVPAWAGGYCSTKVPCTSANDTCMGSYCVPTAKLCTGDSACAAWEKCDFTCPGGIGSSGGSGGGTTTVSDASVSVSDGVSWGSTDAGSSGSGSVDGSSFPSPQDATGVPVPPDADSIPPSADGFTSWDGGPIDPGSDYNCPKSPGVCVAVLSKIPVDAGCVAFCSALVPCNLQFGSSPTSGSSGGSSGGGGVPPSSADASSTDPSYPDGASGVPDFPDAASYDTNMPQIDGGSSTPGPEAQAQCVQMCGLWKIDQVAVPELTAFEACVSAQTANGCSALETNCKASAQAFIQAATANDSWSLGMGGYSTSTGGGADNTGGSKGGDASPVFANQDAGTSSDSSTGAPQQLGDTVGGDAGGAGNSDSSAAPAKSGCTAGATSSGAATGLGLLTLLAGAFVLRRRQRV